jgi:hypothetical protein
MMGSVLVKPDMSHIEVEPPVFVPNETYIPVAWDLSDFEDKIHAALRDTDHLQRIADNAYKACHDYIAHNVFTTSFNHALVTTKILPLQS